MLQTLTAAYGHEAEVEIVLDRRDRQPWTWVGGEGDRRSRRSLDTDPQNLGCLVMHQL